MSTSVSPPPSNKIPKKRKGEPVCRFMGHEIHLAGANQRIRLAFVQWYQQQVEWYKQHESVGSEGQWEEGTVPERDAAGRVYREAAARLGEGRADVPPLDAAADGRREEVRTP